MATNNDLTPFWEALETNFPLTGLRASLAEKIGTELSVLLEGSGILSFIGQAETYPCPTPGGSDCPRQIVRHSDGRITAVCGNDPPECNDVELTSKDIEMLGVEPERLCETLRGPLLFGGKAERVQDLHHVYRAGTFIPQPGTRQAIYFAARCSAKDYSSVLDVLRARHGLEGLAFLIPTDRFVSEDTIHESGAGGIVVLPLAGIIGVNATGHFFTTADATMLFSGIGRTEPGPVLASDTVFAQVYSRDGWRNLNDAAYHQLVSAADQYDIFADERDRRIIKREPSKKTKGKKKSSANTSTQVQSSFFKMIRKAIEARGTFDPNTNGLTEEHISGKQIFQRARKVFDIKYKGADGKDTWKLFKTGITDNHSVYHFQPDPKVSFALIFLPRT